MGRNQAKKSGETADSRQGRVMEPLHNSVHLTNHQHNTNPSNPGTRLQSRHLELNSHNTSNEMLFKGDVNSLANGGG